MSCINLVFHNSDVLSELAEEPDTRSWLNITIAVQVFSLILCSLAIGLSAFTLAEITCCWRRTVRKAVLQRAKVRPAAITSTSICRLFWDFLSYKLGSRSTHFLRVEFILEVAEVFVQFLALHQFSIAGLSFGFMTVYVGLIFTNAVSAAMIVYLERSRRHDRVAQGRYVRLFVLLDALLDVVYTLYPSFHLIWRYLAIFNADSEYIGDTSYYCPRNEEDARSKKLFEVNSCNDYRAYLLLAEGQETFFGGDGIVDTSIKILARAVPLFLAPVRVKIAFELGYLWSCYDWKRQ
eukprot:g3681.t1